MIALPPLLLFILVVTAAWLGIHDSKHCIWSNSLPGFAVIAASRLIGGAQVALALALYAWGRLPPAELMAVCVLGTVTTFIPPAVYRLGQKGGLNAQRR